MRIAIAAADGGFTSGLAAVIDVVRTAELLRPQVDPTIPPLAVEVLAPRPGIRTGSGFVVADAGPLDRLADADLAVVAAPGQLDERALLGALRGPGVRALVGALADLPATTPVAAACTGTLVLAEAGLLDGRRCTTSWWLTALFRSRYPHVRLDTDAMVVEDGRITTAGAAFAHLDLALALVRGVSLDLAETVARFLLIDRRPAQSSYAALGHLARHDPLVAAFERHVRAHLAHPTDIGAVARALGTSRRTLERRVEATVGLSPLRMIRRLRVEHARHLITTTDRSTDEVAHQVGYRNAATLRSLLRRADSAAHRPGDRTG